MKKQSPRTKPPEKEKPGKQETEEGEDSCRCKEVAQKTPTELFKFMLNDLAFRKKGKGRK